MALVTAAKKPIPECHCELQLQLKSLSSLLKRLPFTVCAEVCSNFCLSFFYCITSIFVFVVFISCFFCFFLKKPS